MKKQPHQKLQVLGKNLECALATALIFCSLWHENDEWILHKQLFQSVVILAFIFLMRSAVSHENEQQKLHCGIIAKQQHVHDPNDARETIFSCCRIKSVSLLRTGKTCCLPPFCSPWLLNHVFHNNTAHHFLL